MLEYKAPFILPWIVLNKEMSPDQPESFVPFISGPEGVPSNCCHFTVCLECIALYVFPSSLGTLEQSRWIDGPASICHKF